MRVLLSRGPARGPVVVVGTTLALVLVIALVAGATAAATGDNCQVAPTPSFTHYFGTVTMAGQLAPVGALVEALNPRGQVVGCFKVSEPGLYGFMRVYGEDTSTSPPLPGMREGETVAFRVAGLTVEPAGAAVLWTGDRDIHEVSLSSPGTAMSLFLPVVRR